MKSSRLAASVVSALFLSLALTPPVAAQESVPLGYGVPKDWHLYVHGAASPTPDPGLVAFERACQHLVSSRIHEDILDLATLRMEEGERQQVRAITEHVLGLLGKVDWSGLMAREVVFAEKLVMPIPEYLLIFRAPAGDGDPVAGLRSMLEGFAKMIGSEARVRDVERRTGLITELSIQGAPVQLAAGMVGDALVISTSTKVTSSVMRRMQNGGKGSIVQDEGFQAAFAQLPEHTEGVVFVNVEDMLQFVGQALNVASAAVGDNEKAAGAVALCGVLLEELDVIDYVAVTTVSDGTTVTATSLTKLDSDFSDSRFAALFTEQQPWVDWHKMVPADATGFVFDSGVDVGGLFDLVVALATENLPNVDWAESRHVAKLREIVGHVSGEMAVISFPRAGDGGCTAGETVCLMRLEKTEGVARWVRAHLDAAARYVHSRGQHMEIETHGELHEVRLAAMPWIRPTFGVHNGMLAIATSRAALEQIDRVGRGEVANIRSSERFAALGVGGGAEAAYLDYGQLDTEMAALADLVGGIGFGMALLPKDRDTRVVIKVGMVLSKLALALRELDLRYDTAGEMLSSQSPDTVMGRRVYRYR